MQANSVCKSSVFKTRAQGGNTCPELLEARRIGADVNEECTLLFSALMVWPGTFCYLDAKYRVLASRGIP